MKRLKVLLLTAIMLLGLSMTYGETETQMIDLGDHSLYVKDNNPNIENQVTIIFEPGYGDDMSSFDQIANSLEGKARLIQYDRAGLGQSLDTKKRKTTKQQVKSLEKIISALDIDDNIIIVAHSIGGYNARVFAKRNDVSGIVLIDASHEKQNKDLKKLLPEETWKMYLTQFTSEGTYEDIIKSSKQVKRARHAFKDIPLILITGNNHGGGEIEDLWKTYQEDVASLSNKSQLHILDSGHYVHHEHPEFVTEKILELINICQ